MTLTEGNHVQPKKQCHRQIWLGHRCDPFLYHGNSLITQLALSYFPCQLKQLTVLALTFTCALTFCLICFLFPGGRKTNLAPEVYFDQSTFVTYFI